MRASIIDLRYHMKDVLKAIQRNEQVTVLYHGKPTAIIMPVKSDATTLKVCDHPFFGSSKQDKKTVKKTIDELRGDRYGSI